jgi:hypothetical protein
VTPGLQGDEAFGYPEFTKWKKGRSMKSNLLLPLVLCFLLSLTVGCSSIDPETGRESLGYIPARWYDLLDIVELNLGIDSDISLYAVVALEPIAVGGGLYDGEKFGMDGRLFGQWSEARMEIDLVLESMIRYKKTPNWGTRYLFDAYYSPHKNTLSGNGRYYEEFGLSPRIFDHERRLLDLTAEVHVIGLGIDVGFSLMELLDFATGLLGIDVICDDDWVVPLSKRDVPFSGEEEEAKATITVEEE